MVRSAISPHLRCVPITTHVDAPYHFLDSEETIDRVPLEKFIGYAYVAEHDGDITAETAEKILSDAKTADIRAYERILVKGNAVMTKEGAEVFAKKILLKKGAQTEWMHHSQNAYPLYATGRCSW